MPQDDAAELLTSPQVGQMIGRSARTVHRLVEAGRLVPAQRLPGPNGPMLFRRADVEALLASHAA